MGISVYLLWGSLASGGLPGCGPASGCDTVLTSRWSSWFGVPVSLPAILVYACVLAGLVWRTKTSDPVMTARVTVGLGVLGVVILGAAVWFTMLQLVVIRAVCPFCMIAHGCGLWVGIQLLRKMKSGSAGGGAASDRGRMATAAFRRAVGVGSGAIALLVLGQLLYEPPAFRVTGVAAATIEETTVSPPPDPGAAEKPEADLTQQEAVQQEATASVESPPPPTVPVTRLLSVHDGEFVFDLHRVPVIGSPTAPTVVLHFFDYTCSHCRALHPLLNQAYEALGDRLALVSLPVPLEMDCNPILQRPMPAHINACIHARIGLAVWRVAPDKLHSYDDWFFAFPEPPSPEAARAEARRLLGTNDLEQALRDPWIDEHLAKSISLYHTNYLRYRRSTLPLLMVGTNLVSGLLRTTNQLYTVLGISP